MRILPKESGVSSLGSLIRSTNWEPSQGQILVSSKGKRNKIWEKTGPPLGAHRLKDLGEEMAMGRKRREIL